MKIVIIASFSQSLVNFRGPLIKAMLARGNQVICVAPDNIAEPEIRKIGGDFFCLPLSRSGLNPISDLLYLKKLISLFNSIKPDALLSYTIKPVIYGSVAARIAGIKNIFSIITGLGFSFMGETNTQKFVGLVAKMLYRCFLHYNNRVFFQNPDDLNEFIQRNLIISDKAVLINGSGVDLNYFSRQPTKNNQPVFLLISRLLREKGIFEYITAAEIVKKSHSDAKFILIGPTDPCPSSISLNEISDFVSKGVIEYEGWVKDVRPYIEKANIFVLPSYREGTPRTVLEAMAIGRPIITTDAPGCRETVINGYNGFLVKPRDNSSLVEAMVQFINNPDLIIKMGLAGRKLAEEKYDVNQVNEVILKNMKLV